MRKFIVFLLLASCCSSLRAKVVIDVDDVLLTDGDLGTAISIGIANANSKGETIYVNFTKGKTYTFYRSIVLRDNTAINGNGCTIRFNTNPDIHAMHIYNSFITNRKCESMDGTIHKFKRTLYAMKNITIRDINFECNSDNQFWFNVDSERGIIALYGIDGLKIENCVFDQTWRNTPIWMGNIKNAEISHCKFIESIANKGQRGSSGGIWTNIGSYLDNVSIHDNEFTNYRDESLSIFSNGNEAKRYVDKIDIYNNVFNSRYYAITMSAGGVSGEVDIHNNTFNDFDCQTNPLALEVGGSYRKLTICSNKFLRKTDKSVIAVVAKIDIDSFVFKNNEIAHGNITYTYLPTISKYCSIKGNTLQNASNILSITCRMPICIDDNVFNIRNAKDQCLFNINNGQEQDYIRNNVFNIRNSEGVMLLSQYGYGYSICKNRLTFTGNKVRFSNTNTPFFHNDEKGKIITMTVKNNDFKGISKVMLRQRIK